MKKLIFTLCVFLLFGANLFAASIISETFNPTKDGFVKQVDGTYVDTYENMELSSYTLQNREIFLDFDLAAITITPLHATLRVYVNSISSSTPFIVAAYGQTGNAISESLTYTNRPVTGQRSVDVHANVDSVGKWIQFDFSDFIKAQNLSANKLFSFRIAVVYPTTTSSTCPLITIGSTESENKPQLVLSDTPVPGIYEVPYSLINSITSSATFTAAGNPTNAFNGAGLLPGMCHETAADNKSWRNSAGSFPISLTVKLNDAINIRKFHIWNMNWLFGTGLADYTDRGVKNIDIFISTSTDDMSAVTDFTDARWIKVSAAGLTLTRATGSTSYTGEDVSVTNADNARWFAYKITSNYAASGAYVGLSEVKVYKEVKAIIDTPTAIGKIAKSNIIVSSNNGTLSIDNITPTNRLELYNMQGQLIHSQINKGTNLHLQVPAGVYLVKVNGISVKAVNN